MAGLTIRNLDEPLKKRLRIQAAHNGRSMEEEVRQILRRVLETGLIQTEALDPIGSVAMQTLPPPPAMRTASQAIATVDQSTSSFADRVSTQHVAPPPIEDRPALATATASDLPPSLQASRSVEAFTDGLRQRLALLVGVDTASAPRG